MMKFMSHQEPKLTITGVKFLIYLNASDNLTGYEHNTTLRKAMRVRPLRHSGYESLTQDSQTHHPIL